MSRTHILAFTYKPKIKKVLSGECTQTIRKVKYSNPRTHKRWEPGDYLILHGWEGIPYRSKWSWRKKVRLKEIKPVHINHYGIMFQDEMPVRHPWDSEICDELAKKDGIEPAKGISLRNVLADLNGPDWEGWYAIITWEADAE